jgi:Tol biopolymer transport system component
VIVDAQGKATDWSGERQPFEAALTASPEGDRVASVIANTGALYEIWISERGRPASHRVVAIDGVDVSLPVWSPDGTKIAYMRTARSEEDGVYVVAVDGSGVPRRVVKGSQDDQMIPTSWSPDGSQLLLTSGRAGRPRILVASASGADEMNPREIFAGSGRRGMGRFSPDGRLIGYMSDELGTFEAFVSAWDGRAPVGQAVPVSSGGGGGLLWSRDGSRVYYLNPQNKVMSSTIQREPRLNASQPVEVWDLDQLRIVPAGAGLPLFDALPGGGMVAVRKGDTEDDVTRFELVLNFDEELKSRFR